MDCQFNLHTKYHGYRLCGFKQEFFPHIFHIQAYVIHVTHGAGPFWSHGHYSNQGYNLTNLGRGLLGDDFNKLGRGLLGDNTYQKSKLYALLFQTGRFFHIFPTYAFLLHVTWDVWIFGPRGII